MSYANNKITSPVSIYDVQRALGVGSTDLATLCQHQNVNPWARFKPIPITNGTEGGSPQPITDLIRKKYNYGLNVIGLWNGNIAYDTFFNTILAANEAGTLDNDHIVSKLTWGQNMFRRLSDFVQYNNGAAGTGGYLHTAQPVTNTWIDTEGVLGTAGKTYNIHPTIPEEQRTMYIVDGEKLWFAIPNDNQMIYRWLQVAEGIPGASGAIDVPGDSLTYLEMMQYVLDNGERIDLFTQSTAYNKLRRGIAISGYIESHSRMDILHKEWPKNVIYDINDARCNLSLGHDTDANGYDKLYYGPTQANLVSPENILAPLNSQYAYDLKTFTVTEFFYVPVSGSLTQNYYIPIPGLCYQITINRVSSGGTTGTPDIVNVLGFGNITVDSSGDANINIYTKQQKTQSTLIPYMIELYSLVTATVGGTAYSLISNSVYVIEDGIEIGGIYDGWYRFSVAFMDSATSYIGTPATITGRLTGESTDLTKTVSIIAS